MIAFDALMGFATRAVAAIVLTVLLAGWSSRTASAQPVAPVDEKGQPQAPAADGAADARNDQLLQDDAPAKPPPRAKARDYVGTRDKERNADGVYQFESLAYVVNTDVDKAVANEIAAHLDVVYREYASRLNDFRRNPWAAVKPGQKMPLYVRRRYRDYLTLMKGFGFNAEKSRGVFVRTRDASGLATWVEGQSRSQMYAVLQHEGFHQFADVYLMGVLKLANGDVIDLPPWVNEGLAEYFGDAVVVGKEMRIGRLDRARLSRVRRGIADGVTLPVGELTAMDNDAWVARITKGDRTAELMYDQSWSLCHFLIHGERRRRVALEQYLKRLNEAFVKEPGRDIRADAFREIFGKEPETFEKAWKAGVANMEPDAWLTSFRHLEWVGVALREAHEKGIMVGNWPELIEQMARRRDEVARDAANAKVGGDAGEMNFPAPAKVKVIESDDPKLPPGILITHVVPNLLLSWRVSGNGVLERDIRFVDPPDEQVVEIEEEQRAKAAADRGLKPVEKLEALPGHPPEPFAPEPAK